MKVAKLPKIHIHRHSVVVVVVVVIVVVVVVVTDTTSAAQLTDHFRAAIMANTLALLLLHSLIHLL